MLFILKFFFLFVYPKIITEHHAKNSDLFFFRLFYLNPLEKVLETKIRGNLNDALVAESQHVYTKGRSTESALYAVVGAL